MKKAPAYYENTDQVKLVRYPLFDPYAEELTASYSTRYGGVSEGIYRSMNLSFDQGDSSENVLNNYQLFAKANGTDIYNLVLSSQKHTSNIRMVNNEDIGKGIIKARDYDAIDGLITNVPGIALVTLHADCAPVYIYDPRNKSIGLCHAGWKGTVLEITGKMIELMVENYRSDPADLLVAVGPAICGNCYAVGEEVKKEFDRMSIDVSEYVEYNKRTNRYFPDIALINGTLALNRGVKEEKYPNYRPLHHGGYGHILFPPGT